MIKMREDYSIWLQEIIKISREAGHAIMEVYRGEITVERKNDNSPLTQADLSAHKLIEAGLKELSPDIPLLSEESASIPFSERSTWQRYWLVDPLDGTREFIKRNGEFTVNIALIDQGIPILGVVYAPAIDVLYYASAGSGAFKQVGQGSIQAIHVRSLDFNNLVIAGSRSHSDIKLQRFVSNIAKKYAEPTVIPMGSSLKICMVAEGAADIYPRLGPTSEWDTAAAQCVLEQAGGRLTNKNGVPFTYNHKDSLLNAEFFAHSATPHQWNQYLE